MSSNAPGWSFSSSAIEEIVDLSHPLGVSITDLAEVGILTPWERLPACRLPMAGQGKAVRSGNGLSAAFLLVLYYRESAIPTPEAGPVPGTGLRGCAEEEPMFRRFHFEEDIYCTLE